MATVISRTPLRMRVWAAIRNNPGISYATIFEKLKEENPKSITSILSLLELSDSVFSKYVGNIKIFFTNFDKYEQVQKQMTRYRNEVWQKTAPQFLSENQAITVLPEDPRTSLVLDRTEPQLSKVDQLFNSLTLPEGLELFKRLQAVFL